MEIVNRQKIGSDDGPAGPNLPISYSDQPGSPEEFHVRQLRARDMLRGEVEGQDLQQYVEERVLTTTLDRALNWARSNALFPATFGLACCAIEMMSIVSARYDSSRFGAEVFRASPRQADLLVLSGRVSIKMVPVIRRIYDQMLEPKWVIAMGACSSSGGVFSNYAVVQGADKFLPVDIHVPGCPPRPEALLHGVLKLQRKIQGEPDLGWRARYHAEGTEEWPHGSANAPQVSDLSEPSLPEFTAEAEAQTGREHAWFGSASTPAAGSESLVDSEPVAPIEPDGTPSADEAGVAPEVGANREEGPGA